MSAELSAMASVSVLGAETNGPPNVVLVPSVAVTMTVKVPDCVGVPDIWPLGPSSVSPAGRPDAEKL